MKRVEVKLHTANVLRYLGSIYRNPADAIKEYVSNALDSFLANPGAVNICQVDFHFTPKSIIIDYNTPGMNQREFESALQSVADSVKQEMNVLQIGRLGIGIWAFHQFARRAKFLSRGTEGTETIKVILREGWEEAEIAKALKKEQLTYPGMRIEITELRTQPTSKRSPLAPEKLTKVFAEKFDSYLRKGLLRINISCRDKNYQAQPMEIALPRLAVDYSQQYVSGDCNKKIELFLWFEPAGKGKVAIRHMGIPIVEDTSNISSYGLEESIYARGNVFGYIDADFLMPLPARTMFEESRDWISFLAVLDRIRPSIEAEVELLKAEFQSERSKEIYQKALKLVDELLRTEGLTDLEWLGGRKEPRKPKLPEEQPEIPKIQKEQSRPKVTSHPLKHRKGLGTVEDEKGFKIALQEFPFETGPFLHSRFVNGVVQVNTLNPDYQFEMRKSDKEKICYLAAIIGKEVIAFNDKTRSVDRFLEKELTMRFVMKRKIER